MNSDFLFIVEIKIFLFITKWIWPIQKHLSRTKVSKRCKICAASENLYKLNSNGVCTACLDFQEKHKSGQLDIRAQMILQNPDGEKLEEFNQMMLEVCRRTELRYHVIVMFSGGKDSNVMLNRLIRNYPQLRILVVSFDNTFMSPIAMKNIKMTIGKYPVDHLMMRPSEKFMNKMMRRAFFEAQRLGSSHSVDMFDGDIIHDYAKNMAYEMKIPYILSGLSPIQVKQIIKLESFCKSIEKEAETRKMIAGVDLYKEFGDEAYKYFWKNPKGGTNEALVDVPRVLYPFRVWGYNEQEILEEAARDGLIDNKKSNHPLLTNNQLIPLMTVVDILNLTYSSYEPEFSELIRSGRASRDEWKNLFEMSEFSALTGMFLKKSVDPILKRLELKLEDITRPLKK